MTTAKPLARNEPPSLLHEIIRCSQCTNPLTTRTKKGKRHYDCVRTTGTSHCGETSIAGEETDAVVLGAIIVALNTAGPGRTGDQLKKHIRSMPMSVAQDIVEDVCAKILADPTPATHARFDPQRISIKLR